MAEETFSYRFSLAGSTCLGDLSENERKSIMGSDHGAGHPLLILCPEKTPNYRKNNMLKELDHYSKWPKVANAVIEAL